MNPIKKYIILPITVMICFVSCKKFVDVGPPTSQLLTTNVFSNVSTATSAQLAVYPEIGGLANIAPNPAISSDELNTASTTPVTKDIFANSLSAVADAT